MGTFYYDKALRDTRLPMDTFRKYVSSGIAAEDKALKLNSEYYEAVTFKKMLIGLQASRERDVAVQKRLLGEATALGSAARPAEEAGGRRRCNRGGQRQTEAGRKLGRAAKGKSQKQK